MDRDDVHILYVEHMNSVFDQTQIIYVNMIIYKYILLKMQQTISYLRLKS